MKVIDRRDYKLENILLDEEDFLDQVEKRVSEFKDEQLWTIFFEVAEKYVPTNSNSIWNNAKDIKDYITGAINNGLSEGCMNIDDVLKSGYLFFYTELADKNFNTIVFNSVAMYVNSKCENLVDVNINKILENKINQRIHFKLSSLDVKELADELLEYIVKLEIITNSF